GDLHRVAEAAVAIVEAAEDVALVALFLGVGIVLVVEARELGGAILKRGHRLLLRLACGGKIATAEGFLGALLPLDGGAEQLARARGFLAVDAVALNAGTSRLAAGAAAIGLLALSLTLTGLIARTLAGLVALSALALLLSGLLTLTLALARLLALTLL